MALAQRQGRETNPGCPRGPHRRRSQGACGTAPACVVCAGQWGRAAASGGSPPSPHSPPGRGRGRGHQAGCRSADVGATGSPPGPPRAGSRRVQAQGRPCPAPGSLWLVQEAQGLGIRLHKPGVSQRTRASPPPPYRSGGNGQVGRAGGQSVCQNGGLCQRPRGSLLKETGRGWFSGGKALPHFDRPGH